MTASELFHKAFPYYLSIGMTADEYWNQDSSLVIAYREAQKMREQRENFFAWLHGRYVYDALCLASPIFHDFAKAGTKARPYVEKPYELQPSRPTKDENEQQQQRGLAAFKNMAARFNRNFQEREARRLVDDNPGGNT